MIGILLAACGGTPSPSLGPEPSPPPEAEVLLRVDHEQAIPPLGRFGWMPPVVISLDRLVLMEGPVPAIFPGPLVAPIVQRQLTLAGWEKIVAAARAAGILSGVSSFGQAEPGAEILRLRLVADGRTYDITGSNRAPACITTPCQPPPGTGEAFTAFVGSLVDLASWLGSDIGAEAAYEPAGYAIVVGPVPDDQGLPQPSIDWPFADGFAGFGAPFADGSGFRCGALAANDAETLRPALEHATQITRWRDPVDRSFHGLTVKPLLPGEGDPCEALV